MVASMKSLLGNMAIAAGCLLCMTALAEPLADPTRPAIELVPGLGAAATGESAQPARTAKQGLQSVILSPQREAAIIDGVEVERGRKYGDAVLTVVNETCVVLMGPEGRQVLHMFPDVSMSKDEQACIKRTTMQPIVPAAQSAGQVAQEAAVRSVKKAKSRKKAKTKPVPVTCVAEEKKDGSKQ